MKYIEGECPFCSLRCHASLSICSSLKWWHTLQKVVQNMMERPKPRTPRKMLEGEREERVGERRMREMMMEDNAEEDRGWEIV